MSTGLICTQNSNNCKFNLDKTLQDINALFHIVEQSCFNLSCLSFSCFSLSSSASVALVLCLKWPTIFLEQLKRVSIAVTRLVDCCLQTVCSKSLSLLAYFTFQKVPSRLHVGGLIMNHRHNTTLLRQSCTLGNIDAFFFDCLSTVLQQSSPEITGIAIQVNVHETACNTAVMIFFHARRNVY